MGACTGEGTCAPGERTRSGDGCPAGETRDQVCSATCAYEPAGACMADGCPTPGALETVPCGMCGTLERFCSAARVWEYGACSGEGVCMPGTTSSTSCGMCGTQTLRCSATCAYIPFGACGGEGTCVPGTTQRTTAGCAAGASRILQCDPACGYTIEVSPCGTPPAVDVTFLLDMTGSNLGSVSDDLPTITSRCITPLLAFPDVRVGASYAGEFPVSPYGITGDRPFEGGIEPSASAAAIATELTGRTTFSGSDASDSMVEALSVLAGGTLATSALPLTCSAGRVAGGCWRPLARRVIVIHTDSAIHQGPDVTGPGIYDPYAGITPTPATWPAVRTRLVTDGTLVIWLDSGALAPGPAQYDEMLTDLAQPLTDHHLAATSTAVGTACDAIVARVRAIVMP